MELRDGLEGCGRRGNIEGFAVAIRAILLSLDELLKCVPDGCLLFRTFLKGEFSDENVDFWIECEEFRKMKEGKKSTIQKAHAIYNQYIAEQSPKEVNLDSDTRAATKAALESGARLNTFSLAQTRIEQLMAKDSYRRFLKSKLFLDLLNNGSTSNGSTESSTEKLPQADHKDRGR
ncbi:unnamed protein product [Gongylonema pulchrum]|uniref:RGS domain-containing protein n=1 Tax=Gongylonema pulchrum TaxID=637853 RepID=A0A183D5A9_9BILA|nr:unnamed protein product [Gongylonema pulchrum]